MANQPRLKIALFGLGRLGSIRAQILLTQQPRMELVAACDTKPGADKWAAENLPSSVTFFADPEKCMRDSGAQAVLISTATATHAPLICLALDLGLEVIAKAATKPHLKFLIPLTRRYDDNFRAAKRLVDAGTLGDIHAVETSSQDKQDKSGFFIAFSLQSGGIFVDMGVHDIDVGRYYLNPTVGLTNLKKQVNRVIAMGQRTLYGALAEFEDFDNAWGIVEFANGKIMTSHVGRTTSHGHEGSTRILGTKGHSLVDGVASQFQVEVRDEHGVRRAIPPDAFQLYDRSFPNDLAEFATAVLDDAPLSCRPEDAFEAAKITIALQHSMRIGQPVYFDDEGLPILISKDNTTSVDSNGVNGTAPVNGLKGSD
ncbi:hypothetical protein N0V91_009875 [Didymella pomorum]|uniref:NAD binding Rossmann fold oxidoreductase n=1 Tax=Didymella pomorum TaxID=749634 RepID=A0A9W8Z6D4_9PLEO|nr:hypothetical protein N0V91_009875 [Didymella pomorum]